MPHNSTVQLLLDAKTAIETALPNETPEERLQMVGLLLLGPGHSDTTHRPAQTKGEQLIEMLRRPQGASLDDVINTFGMKRNSAYARISVEVRRRHLKVERNDGVYRVHA